MTLTEQLEEVLLLLDETPYEGDHVELWEINKDSNEPLTFTCEYALRIPTLTSEAFESPDFEDLKILVEEALYEDQIARQVAQAESREAR